MVLKFAAKALTLALMVTAVQVLICGPMHQAEPVKKLANCLEQKPDVIYFCDSCNAWVDANDNDRRWISKMLHERLPNKNVVSLDGGAFHLELYAAFVDVIVNRKIKPDLLIIPINLRSFSPEWDARPSYSFRDSIQQLQKLDRPFASAFAPLMKTLQWEPEVTESMSEYRKTSVLDGKQVVGTVADFDGSEYRNPTPENLRKKFIFHYMYTLQEDHRKLTALRRIAEQTSQAGIPVVFYVTPIDFETGMESLGPRFAEQVMANISQIRKQVSGYPVSFLDLSHDLNASAFSWLEYPNEHLNETGRSYIAAQLAHHLADRYAFQVEMETHTATSTAPAPIVR